MLNAAVASALCRGKVTHRFARTLDRCEPASFFVTSDGMAFAHAKAVALFGGRIGDGFAGNS